MLWLACVCLGGLCIPSDSDDHVNVGAVSLIGYWVRKRINNQDGMPPGGASTERTTWHKAMKKDDLLNESTRPPDHSNHNIYTY